MINFVTNNATYYMGVLYTLINPIAEHLDNYIISEKVKDNCINIHFFKEQAYINAVGGLKGKNVFISHGIGDKLWREYKYLTNFDYIVVSGDLWYDKMINQGCPKEKLIIGGYPKIDLLWDKKKSNNDKKVILWCPTHNVNLKNPSGFSTYPKFKEHIQQLPSEFEFIESAHPANKDHRNPTTLELVFADIIISDYSSAFYEAWALGKPVIFPDWLVKDYILKYSRTSFEEKIYTEHIGYHAKDINELNKLLYVAIEKGLDEKTQNFIEGILPTRLRGISGKEIADFLNKID